MKLGLVLDGGGAKGAYQIGVWKAMREYGIDKQVRAVAGTSVGGLNAALFAQGDFDLAYKIWTEEIGRIRILSIQKDLERMIDQYIDFSAIADSSIDCFLAAYSIGDPGAYLEMEQQGTSVGTYVIGEVVYYNLRCMSEKNSDILVRTCSMPKAVLLASSAIPFLCKGVWIGKKLHQDGGVPWGGDNSPDYPIAWGADCDTMLVVHLSHAIWTERVRYPDMNVLEIIPTVSLQDLGFFQGTLNFDPQYAKKMMDAGYRDSMAVFEKELRIMQTANRSIPTDQRFDEMKRQLEYEDFEDLRDALYRWTN